MAEERQCMCTTPEITIKLNKQGPQGKVGPQGEPGFSPYIGVANDTPSQYILRITNEDGEYLTPNLKANIPLGGNTGDVLTKNSDVNGDCSFKALPYASTSQQGVVYLATTEEALLGDPDYVITGEVLLGVLANKIGNGTITITQGGVTKGTFTTNQAGNTSISLDDTTYTAGKNIVITGTSIATSNNPIFDRAISFTDRNGSEYEALSIEGLYPNTYLKVGMSNQGLQLSSSTSTITTRRNGNDYINIDSGNLGNYVDGTTITYSNGQLSAVSGGGSSYTAGNGIDITNNTISIDDAVVVTQSDISNMVTTNTAQTITGLKTFDTQVSVNGTILARYTAGASQRVEFHPTMNGAFLGLYTTDNWDGKIEVGGSGSSRYMNIDAPYESTDLRINPLNNATTLTLYGSNINTIRNNQTYTNIDSGNIGDYALTSSNISSNAYIQALEAKITALETNINGGNANA